MKEVSGREMLNVGTPRMGKDEAVAPVTDLTDISRVESRRLYRQALKRKKREREREITQARMIQKPEWKQMKKLKTLKCVPTIDKGIKSKFFLRLNQEIQNNIFPPVYKT